MLKNARILSANRTLDTKSWGTQVDQKTNSVVLSKSMTLGEADAKAAVLTAIGDLYGAIVETELDQRVRFEIEIAPIIDDGERLAIRAFKNCIFQNRVPEPDGANRG